MALNLQDIRNRLEYARRMDALVGLVDGVRARGAFLLRLISGSAVGDADPRRALTLICQTLGSAVITTAAGETSDWHPDDVALARGTEHYVYSDDLGSTPRWWYTPVSVAPVPTGATCGSRWRSVSAPGATAPPAPTVP